MLFKHKNSSKRLACLSLSALGSFALKVDSWRTTDYWKLVLTPDHQTALVPSYSKNKIRGCMQNVYKCNAAIYQEWDLDLDFDFNFHVDVVPMGMTALWYAPHKLEERLGGKFVVICQSLELWDLSWWGRTQDLSTTYDTVQWRFVHVHLTIFLFLSALCQPTRSSMAKYEVLLLQISACCVFVTIFLIIVNSKQKLADLQVLYVKSPQLIPAETIYHARSLSPDVIAETHRK